MSAFPLGGVLSENAAKIGPSLGLEMTGVQVSKPPQYLAQYAVYGASRSSI
jgi:hypothetical protein